MKSHKIIIFFASMNLPKLYLALTGIVILILGITQIFTESIDIVRRIHLLNTNELDTFFKYYTQFGETPLILGSLLIVWRMHPSYFKAALISVLVNTIIIQGLKHGIGSPRPYWELGDEFREIDGVAILKSLSFPSGHSAAAVLGCGFLSFIFIKWWQQLLLWIAAISVAYSRMYLGLHYSLDIWAGLIIGTCSLWFFLYLVRQK